MKALDEADLRAKSKREKKMAVFNRFQQTRSGAHGHIRIYMGEVSGEEQPLPGPLPDVSFEFSGSVFQTIDNVPLSIQMAAIRLDAEAALIV